MYVANSGAHHFDSVIKSTHDIDSIVKDRVITEPKPIQVQHTVPLFNNQTKITHHFPQQSNNNQKTVDNKAFVHNKKMESLKKIAVNSKEQSFVAEKAPIFNGFGSNATENNSYFGTMYHRYSDVGSEVKHATTPLNAVHETHSPQLPAPSPNYPIQTQLADNSAADGKQSNPFVPTINNNYLIAPSQQTTPSAHSNNDRPSDLKDQSEHLSNLGLSSDENKAGNLNKVNLPKTECDIKETAIGCSDFGENWNPESSFTVLNIPNLNFQAPPAKKQKLSRIDLATLKRKTRRKRPIAKSVNPKVRKNSTSEFGVQICGYSDSSSSSIYSSSDCESDCSKSDLWITSGPPAKPDLKPEKLRFLKMLGLTTHLEENCK